MPVALLNFFIAAVNIYFLWRLYTKKDHFRILHASTEDQYLNEFIDLNEKDILNFFPSFNLKNNKKIALMIHRNLALAGILIGHQTDDHTLHVDLDFVLPQYRDMKTGNYLFRENASFFTSKGINTIISESGSKEHSRYLKKTGFALQNNQFILHLT